jgi:hypothetical protein
MPPYSSAQPTSAVLRSGVINVGAMIDANHMHSAGGLVDAVDHAVGAAVGRTVSGQLAGQRPAHYVRAFQQYSGSPSPSVAGRQCRVAWTTQVLQRMVGKFRIYPRSSGSEPFAASKRIR